MGNDRTTWAANFHPDKDNSGLLAQQKLKSHHVSHGSPHWGEMSTLSGMSIWLASAGPRAFTCAMSADMEHCSSGKHLTSGLQLMAFYFSYFSCTRAISPFLLFILLCKYLLTHLQKIAASQKLLIEDLICDSGNLPSTFLIQPDHSLLELVTNLPGLASHQQENNSSRKNNKKSKLLKSHLWNNNGGVPKIFLSLSNICNT